METTMVTGWAISICIGLFVFIAAYVVVFLVADLMLIRSDDE